MWAGPHGCPGRLLALKPPCTALKKHNMSLDQRVKLVWEGRVLLREASLRGTKVINACSVSFPRNCEIA